MLSIVDREVEAIEAVGVPVLTRKVDIANVRAAIQERLHRQPDGEPDQPGARPEDPLLSAGALRVDRLRGEGSRDVPARAAGRRAADDRRRQASGGRRRAAQGELEDFVAAVRDGRAPAVPGEQGRARAGVGGTDRGVDAAVNINLAIAARARAGEALTVAEIDELGSSDVLSLGMLADEVRRARVGESVTYIRVIEMAGGAGEAGGAGVEMRLSSLPATLDEAEGLIAEARMLAGPQLLTGFSLADIADRHWGKLADVLKRLKRAGLDAIVEAPVDRLHDAQDTLAACEAADLPVRCLSLHSPIEGDGRSSWLIHLRELVTKFPKVDTVNPLSREQSIAVPTTGYEDVRAVALARLVLPSVKNIQVDWDAVRSEAGAGGVDVRRERSRSRLDA